MTAYRHQSMPCPSCKVEVNTATNLVGEEGPQPGDLSICRYCHATLRFDDGLQLQLLTSENLEQLPYEARTALKKAHEILDQITAQA